MDTGNDFASLVPLLKEHFDALQNRFTSFASHGVQTEAWLKGEMLALLDAWRAAGRIRGFDREVTITSGKKVDLVIDTAEARHWVELKHWLIGPQKGFSYNCRSYFSDPTSVGILPDVKKLQAPDLIGHRWLLILLTANPGSAEWLAGVEHFNSKFAPQGLRVAGDINGFPPPYALGLLAVVWPREGAQLRLARGRSEIVYGAGVHKSSARCG